MIIPPIVRCDGFSPSRTRHHTNNRSPVQVLLKARPGRRREKWNHLPGKKSGFSLAPGLPAAKITAAATASMLSRKLFYDRKGGGNFRIAEMAPNIKTFFAAYFAYNQDQGVDE
jgi:hypothetical protein